MKRNLISFAVLAAVGLSAHAGVFGNTTYNDNSVKPTANANANAVAAANANAAAVANQHQGQAQVQGQVQGQSAVSSSGGNVQSNAGNNASQSTNVNVEAEKTWRTAASATAAALTSANGTCMGSSSVGAQGTFGLSFGTTWTDTSCDIRYDAQALAAMGLKDAATARLCQKAEIADAMALAGTPCPAAKKVAAAPVQPVPAPLVSTAAYTGSDPIVMKRLGL